MTRATSKSGSADERSPKKAPIRDVLQFLGACAVALVLAVGSISYGFEHPHADVRLSHIWAVGSVLFIFGWLLRQFRAYLRVWRFWLFYACALVIHIAAYARLVAGSELRALPLMVLTFVEYLVLVAVFSLAIGPASKA